MTDFPSSICQEFWALVSRSRSCWVWKGNTFKRGGYGRVRSGLSKLFGSGRAHKVAWIIMKGPVPAGYDLHHVCENKLCVRPAKGHVWPMISADHSRMEQKKRVQQGTHHLLRQNMTTKRSEQIKSWRLSGAIANRRGHV